MPFLVYSLIKASRQSAQQAPKVGPDGLQNHRTKRVKVAEGKRKRIETAKTAWACAESERGADQVLERSDSVQIEELVGEAWQVQSHGDGQRQEANESVEQADEGAERRYWAAKDHVGAGQAGQTS